MTPRELLFIEYHVIKGEPRRKAMILAGFTENSEGMYYYRSQKIIRKFESREEDHREIMRALGAGEVFIINSMYSLAKSAKSEIVQKGALDSLARWIGMDKELVQGSHGVTVIIQGADGAQQQVNIPLTLPARPPSQAQTRPHTSTPSTRPRQTHYNP